MRKLYALKGKLFTSWCGDRQLNPVNCPIGTVVEFLQAPLSAGLTHSTLKVYGVAISAYHASLGGQSVGRNLLVTRFLHGALRPPVRSWVPSWALAVVLEALCGLPSRKVPSSAPQPIVMQAFCPPRFREPDQQKHNCMCPVRAVCSVTVPLKEVCRLKAANGIVDSINICFEYSQLPSPMGVRAHSTRSVAFLAGVPIQDICNVAGWSTPLTVLRFYGLDMRATPGSSVLSPLSCS